MKRRKHLFKTQFHLIFERIFSLFKNPIFWILTIGGNTFILCGAFCLQLIEGPTNPAAAELIDCLIWAIGLITTVGSSSLHPITFFGKVLMILMMIGGTVFLWSYMTLFIAILVGPELSQIEQDVTKLQKSTQYEDKLLENIRELVRNSRTETTEKAQQ